MKDKIKVTINQKLALNTYVKQLVTLNLKKPSNNTTQDDINRAISAVSAKFHDLFEITDDEQDEDPQ